MRAAFFPGSRCGGARGESAPTTRAYSERAGIRPAHMLAQERAGVKDSPALPAIARAGPLAHLVGEVTGGQVLRRLLLERWFLLAADPRHARDRAARVEPA